ncbi:helix-turn-helix domain-containing protein [Pseudobacteroides cellulosolvens]|uniref:Helix-turn-helix domain-containing protein n=1 Tax=Pseudobacteroides cellulosolvens ATCC 35603 = DSM 2933 TaxID=398512 RepID=A0A0L6JV14_9FIRM|nr:helix-turn-helix domain-containing protein [Pseudobacteroides cellulosolvens]KNY29495.1 hypothetical protein Bccel_4769 [Pseudobacteroides cellulosolvens ATCC 35603 = DSM 2933]
MAKIEFMTNAFQSDLKPRARLVLNCLALHCNKDGQCFPSIRTIARECGYSVNTVKRALDDLVKAGFVVKEARFDKERKHGGQTSNLYTLNIVETKKDEKQGVNEEKGKNNEKEGSLKKVAVKKDNVNSGLGETHLCNDDFREIKRGEKRYSSYEFTWAGEQPKGASP